jgi:uncharacterized protein CbrC (UPF0167 family)
MTFKYYDKPELFTGFRDTETTCDTCGQEKICFDAAAFYGTEDLKSICPDCLLGGQLNDKNVFTCNGDIEELERQLKVLNPTLTDLEIENIAKQKTTELEKTTPHLVTWQDWSWPCADGDYCKFIGFGSKPFYKSLTTDLPTEDFFKNSFFDSNSDTDYLWKKALPNKEIKNYQDSNKYGTLFYVFRSLNSDKILTMWDCD